MLFTLISLLDVFTAIIALYFIYYGGLQGIAVALLTVLLLKGVWSFMTTLK